MARLRTVPTLVLAALALSSVHGQVAEPAPSKQVQTPAGTQTVIPTGTPAPRRVRIAPAAREQEPATEIESSYQ